MLYAHVQLFLKTLALMCLLVKFPRFCPPQSMFKIINAEMTPKKARAKRAHIFFKSYLTLYVMCVVFFDENWTFLK